METYSFCWNKNTTPSYNFDSDERVVKDLLEEITCKVEKNVSYLKKKRRNPNNNINDLAMTTEKINIWMKEFTFWDTEDGKPATGKKCSWLEINEEYQSFSCWVCRLYPKNANEKNAVYKGCTKWHRNYPVRHCDEKHFNCVALYLKERFGHQPSIEDSVALLKQKSIERSCEELHSLFRTAYFIAKESMALSKFDKICELQQLNGVSIGKNLSNNACERFIASIAEDLKDETKTEFNSARFVSIMADGSTNKGITEQEGIFVRYVKNGYPVTKFAGIENPESVDAEGLTNAILNSMKSLKTSYDQTDPYHEEYLRSVFQRLVNIDVDCASMPGHLTGVQKRLKKRREGPLYTNCAPNLIELAVLDAIKFEDTYIEQFNETLHGIFEYYYDSAQRRKEFKPFADMYEEEVKNLGLMKNKSWLASRGRALSLVEMNYHILIHDLQKMSYVINDTGRNALSYLKFLKQPKFLFYLFYLQDLVAILRSVSIKFQQHWLLVCEIPKIIAKASDQILAFSFNRGENMNRLMSLLKNSEQCPSRLLFKEVVLDETERIRGHHIEHTPQGYEKYFSEHCLNKISLGSIDYLANRFKAFNQTPLKEMVELFDFKEWPKSFKEYDWGIDAVNALTYYYQTNKWITEEETVAAFHQWIPFRNKVSKLKHSNLIDVFSDMLLERDHNFSGINVLLEIMMTFSASTAACERGFSCMKKQKHALRTTLSHSSLDDMMRICIDGKEISKFNPDNYVKSWMSRGAGTSHVIVYEPPSKRLKAEP